MSGGLGHNHCLQDCNTRPCCPTIVLHKQIHFLTAGLLSFFSSVSLTYYEGFSTSATVKTTEYCNLCTWCVSFESDAYVLCLLYEMTVCTL